MSEIKILIADDHAVVREGTRQILEQEADMNVVGEATDGEEAVRLAGSTKPDVAIIDIAMSKKIYCVTNLIRAGRLFNS